MSQLSRLRQALTPKGGGTVLAFALAVILELVMHLGRIVLGFLIIVTMLGLAFGLGYGATYLAHLVSGLAHG